MVNLAKAKIIIADDEENIVKAVKFILEKEGYDIEVAYDGQEVIDKINKYSPDIILLDVMMPRKTGYEVCSILKADKETQLIPIIIVTALKQKEERLKGIEAGADDFISKPIDQRELLTRIKSLLRIKVLNDELKNNFNKLKSLEEYKADLTDMIVHDMKNLLMGSIGNVEMLLKDTVNLTEMQQTLLLNTQSSNDDLLRMILNLLEISMMEENRLKINCKHISLEDIIKHSVDAQQSLAKQANKSIIATINVKENTKVYADGDILERIVINLLNNAIKHSPKGQKIKVNARTEAEKNCIEVSVENDGDYIPKELHGKIFEKFGQIGRSAGMQRMNKGLGLTFCKLAVEAHKGKLWLESGVDGHNEFFFSVPLSPDSK